MSASVNKVTLIGNLGKDPESRTFTNGGRVVSFSRATTESWKDRDSGDRKERTQWHQVVIHNPGIADVAMKYLRKGSSAYVEGQLEYRPYEKDGFKHTAAEVVLRPYSGELNLLG